MSRFSPSVLPQGPRRDIGDDLLSGLEQAELHRRQKRTDAQAAEDRTYELEQRGQASEDRARQLRRQGIADSVAAAERHSAGFRTGDQVERASRPDPVTGNVVRDLEGREVRPPHERYQRHGELYLDPDATPDAMRRRRVAAALQEMPDLGPGERALFAEDPDLIEDRLQHGYNVRRDEERNTRQTERDRFIQGQITSRSREARDARAPRAPAPEEAESNLYRQAKQMIERGISPADVANWAARDDQPFKGSLNGPQRHAAINRAVAALRAEERKSRGSTISVGGVEIDLGSTGGTDRSPTTQQQDAAPLTPEQWDALADEARRDGLDPIAAIGHPRPR